MAPPLKQDTALQILKIARKLDKEATFRKILLEAKSQGVLSWDRTHQNQILSSSA